MPPKKNKANGFMIFTKEWKQKYGRGITLQQATQEAGKIWANMNAAQRAPYNDKAKEERMLTCRSSAEKLACTGTPISQLEKERIDREKRERLTKGDIETTVSNSVKEDRLKTQSYYFITVNYFTKTLKGGVYVPAELSVCEFSLKEGVSRVYHTLINPGVNIYGHQYDAQHHSQTTHGLPLPPNALGEKKLGNIYNDVLNFIRDDNSNYYPPVYTHRDNIHVVESVLEFLKVDVGANNIDLKIYPINYLFYILKKTTREEGEVTSEFNTYIADAQFDQDFFEFHIGMACQFHEDNDKCKYCTQCIVTRWGYVFADYMCRDLAISLVPGRHCPINTNVRAIALPPAASSCNDNESVASVDTTITNATRPVADSQLYYDDPSTSRGSRGGSRCDTGKTYTNDFPTLGGRVSKKKSATALSPQQQMSTRNLNDSDGDDSDDYGAPNPWSRSRNIPPQPDTSNFDINFPNDDDLGSDPNDSVASSSGGRGSRRNNSFNTTGGSSFGRGRPYHP